MINSENLPLNVKLLRDSFINKVQKHFSTSDFIFEEVEHKYTLKGKELISATSFIKKFYVEFDTQGQALKYAIKNNLNVDDVLADWKAKGEYARILGSNVHKWLEDYWAGLNPSIPEDPDVASRCKDYLRFHQHNLMAFVPVVQELRVFSEKYGISGMMDSIFLVEKSDGEWVFQIWDWKTNKDGKFTTDSDFNFNKFLLKPFSHMKENEHNKYSLQVSLYKLLLREVGIEVDECYLCHLPPSGNVKVHHAKDLTGQLKNYLENRNTDITSIPTNLF